MRSPLRHRDIVTRRPRPAQLLEDATRLIEPKAWAGGQSSTTGGAIDRARRVPFRRSPVMEGRLDWWTRLPRRWRWLLGGIAAVVTIVIVLWFGPWLLTLAPNHGLTADQELKAKNDVRTTLVQAVAGLAVASGALITYRTFPDNQQDQAKRHDREERTFRLHQSQQVTDTYTKAVEQLGSDQAPVRLGALYSLERLAQDDPSRRQTVVDVMCAYLRMPYTPPTSTKPATVSVTGSVQDASAAHSLEESVDRGAAQELQVRRTAQRLLAEHLRRPRRTLAEEEPQRLQPSPEEGFWPGISLDLSGGTFTEFDGDKMSVARAEFFGATFLGLAWFDKATFSEGLFDSAKFLGSAWFNDAKFVENAGFSGVTFGGHASFHGVTFHRRASFHRASFHEEPTFGYTLVTNLDDPVIGRDAHPFRVWPDGWTVEPDHHDPTRGSLVPMGKDETAGPPSPPSATRA